MEIIRRKIVPPKECIVCKSKKRLVVTELADKDIIYFCMGCWMAEMNLADEEERGLKKRSFYKKIVGE